MHLQGDATVGLKRKRVLIGDMEVEAGEDGATAVRKHTAFGLGLYGPDDGSGMGLYRVTPRPDYRRHEGTVRKVSLKWPSQRIWEHVHLCTFAHPKFSLGQ